MPLLKGKSKAILAKNISELVGSYKKTGTIGNASPATMKKARDQALAIAFNKAGKGK